MSMSPSFSPSAPHSHHQRQLEEEPLLHQYLDRVLPISDFPQAMDMRCEINRLASFNGTSCPASSIRLAQSGFYSEGSGSQSRCYSCGSVYTYWEMMDKPDVVHRRISPDCRHLTVGDDRNHTINIDPRTDVPTHRIYGVIGDYPAVRDNSPQTRPQIHVTCGGSISVPIQHGRANSSRIQQDTQPNCPSMAPSLDHKQDYCLEQLNRAVATYETGRQRR